MSGAAYLVLVSLHGEWLLDSGAGERICSSGADLLEGLRSAPPRDAPLADAPAVVLEARAVSGGWLVAWAGRTMIVRDDVCSADRVWALLAEPTLSLSSLLDRVDSLAFGGAPHDSLRFDLGGESVDVTRGNLRLLSRGLRLARKVGKLVSISPKPSGGGS